MTGFLYAAETKHLTEENAFSTKSSKRYYPALSQYPGLPPAPRQGEYYRRKPNGAGFAFLDREKNRFSDV